MKKLDLFRGLLALAWLVLLVGVGARYAVATNGAYNDGSYGACTYNVCPITLSTSGTLSLDVLPSGTKCTIQSDSVAVTTDSSTGYNLTLSDVDTINGLTSPSGTIAAVSGSQATPTALSANTWGYRVDGVGGFGAGPTSAGSNVPPPSQSFAAVPPSSGSPDTLANSSSPADPTVTTPVWFGVCADATTTADTYADSVIYTALIN